MKSILLTRSPEENAKLESILKKYGSFRFIHCPLITYQKNYKLDDIKNILSNYEYIVITSKMAARIIAGLAIKKPIKVLVVGEASAKILSDAGIDVVTHAQNVKELITKIPPNLFSKIIYLSGDVITQDLPSPIERKIIYSVKYKKTLDQSVLEEFDNGVDYILLYSSNCAKTLAKLIVQHNLTKSLGKTTLVGISLRTVHYFNDFVSSVIYSNRENQQELIKLLVNHEQNKKNKN